MTAAPSAPAPASPTPLVLPIGHYVGALYPTAGGALKYHEIRIGWSTFPLTDNEFHAWALTHGMPEEIAARPWTLDDARELSRRVGRSTPQAFDDVLRREYAVEVLPGSDDSVRFATQVRLRPLLAGIGNSAEAPLRYGLGLGGTQTVVSVDVLAYQMWTWAGVCDSLWHACRIYARAAEAVPQFGPEDQDPERVLARALPAVQVLIANGAAYLDEARDRDE